MPRPNRVNSPPCAPASGLSTAFYPVTLPASALKPTFCGPHHLLTLSYDEDDGLGEELQGIGEIEPGVRVIEEVALPEPPGFDPPDQLTAFLGAVRWGAASTADVKNLQAPFRSGINIENDSPRLFALEEPSPGLRAVRVVANEAAQDEKFVVPPNMSVPVGSVIRLPSEAGGER
jgi:hypothetical protein